MERKKRKGEEEREADGKGGPSYFGAVYALGHEVTKDHDVTITSSRGWTTD